MTSIDPDVTQHHDLPALRRHAEYGHLEGQDYDAVMALCDEVQRLRARVVALEDEADRLDDEVSELTDQLNDYQFRAAQAGIDRDVLRAAITEHRDEVHRAEACCAKCLTLGKEYGAGYDRRLWSALRGDADA